MTVLEETSAPQPIDPPLAAFRGAAVSHMLKPVDVTT
jgi:hypothetical protein